MQLGEVAVSQPGFEVRELTEHVGEGLWYATAYPLCTSLKPLQSVVRYNNSRTVRELPLLGNVRLKPTTHFGSFLRKPACSATIPVPYGKYHFGNPPFPSQTRLPALCQRADAQFPALLSLLYNFGGFRRHKCATLAGRVVRAGRKEWLVCVCC